MMARALQLARRGRYSAMPNPHVGCVVVRDGLVIGEGFTQPAGGNHAEIEALEAAGNASGATAYVTLEPCDHQGKTGPCTHALRDAGVIRVVFGASDPGPGSGGAERLREIHFAAPDWRSGRADRRRHPGGWAAAGDTLAT